MSAYAEAHSEQGLLLAAHLDDRQAWVIGAWTQDACFHFSQIAASRAAEFSSVRLAA